VCRALEHRDFIGVRMSPWRGSRTSRCAPCSANRRGRRPRRGAEAEPGVRAGREGSLHRGGCVSEPQPSAPGSSDAVARPVRLRIGCPCWAAQSCRAGGHVARVLLGGAPERRAGDRHLGRRHIGGKGIQRSSQQLRRMSAGLSVTQPSFGGSDAAIGTVVYCACHRGRCRAGMAGADSVVASSAGSRRVGCRSRACRSGGERPMAPSSRSTRPCS
jgi:hypothetical protein